MPLHTGHIALIDFAAEQCDEVIVSMSFNNDDPIPHEKRFHWLVETFRGNEKVIPRLIPDVFDNPDLPLNERTKKWAEVIARVYPRVDVVMSSEPYGEPFAKNLGAKHVAFDNERKQFPISASQIRLKPMSNWQFIPEIVSPFFVKKICFYGAESTGKSTMAEKMAAKYNTVCVPEVAREMLTSNDFTLDDIIKIGHAHLGRILQAIHDANKILLCDTDALTTQIYSQHYLGQIPNELVKVEKLMQYDRYFLFDVDVPWVADGLRDLGHLRKEMHTRFKDELDRREIKYITVTGSWEQREKIVTGEIEKLLRDE